MRTLDIPAARRLLLTREQLMADGWSDRRIERDVAAGQLHRVRRGWYMAGAEWRELWPASRHLAHVVAVNDGARVPPVFAFTSAAAVHGLPLHRVVVDRVHTLYPDVARRTVAGTIRHQGRVNDADVIDIGGILCTSPERTIYDLARHASAEVALACADAQLGRIGGDPREYDATAAEAWLAEMAARIDAARGVRGIRHARMLIEVIDGRSQLPLESITKLQLRRLGFRAPRLQVPVRAPKDGWFWMDIELDEAGAFYECDGETKYTDEAMRSGRTLEQVLLAEKQREDWVRGTTGKRVLRGGSAHAASPEALAARLASFGVALPDRRDRLLLPRRPLAYGQ
ncbi:hypothetical protein [Microbacterium lacus]|uniref:hypothetical protein n=1 Tax=Microbacterium lacus TaxID=415217 RepID=UPI001E5FA53E|nr:hypothetical protein [Microbacterium lacus]